MRGVFQSRKPGRLADRRTRLLLAGVLALTLITVWLGYYYYNRLPYYLQVTAVPAGMTPNTAKTAAIEVLVYSDIKGWYDVPAEPVMCGGDIPVSCSFTTDKTKFGRADGVMFHPPTDGGREGFKGVPPHPYKDRESTQKWVVVTSENHFFYPQLIDPRYMDQFDITMSYSRRSDVPSGYFSKDYFSLNRNCTNLPKPGTPTDDDDDPADVALFVSNCWAYSNREQYSIELMKYLKIHSYGRCLNNKKAPTIQPGVIIGSRKAELISRYKFATAMENAQVYDYITEKLWVPYQTCAVPIYMGATNLKEWAPEGSYLDASAMTPKALADAVHEAATDPEVYATYHAWRTDESKYPAWLNKLSDDFYSDSAPCRLCEELYRLRSKKSKHMQPGGSRVYYTA